MLQANALFVAWASRPELLQEYADDAEVVRAVLICACVGCACSPASTACWRPIACSLGLRWQDRSAMSCASTCLFTPSTSSSLVLSPVASALSTHVCLQSLSIPENQKRDIFERYRLRPTGAALHLLRTIGKRTRSCPRDGSAPLSRRWTALLQLRHHDS